MVRQTTVAGPISRHMGVRLRSQMGEKGEEIIATIAHAEVLGRGSLGGWHGAPPVDVVDFKNRIAYQVKVLTDPLHAVSFSGAHRKVRGTRIGGHPQYVGEPEDKLNDIRAWVKRMGWQPVLVVIILDEDANRATVHATRGVKNVSIREMTPMGVINNDLGVYHVPKLLLGGAKELNLPWSNYERVPRLPDIPTFLRSSTHGEVVPEIRNVKPLFRRPVRVRSYRRQV